MTLKKKFSYKDILYKSKRLMVLGLVVVFGTGIIVSSNLDKKGEVPVHDGEVLVDSLAVTEEEQETAAETGGDFQSMRAQIELERNKLVATLDSTINNSNNDGEKKNASEQKQRIMDYMETELAIESKGLPDSFVLITESSISVTVDQQELDTNTVAKICDIVMRETGKSADKIVIQSKY